MIEKLKALFEKLRGLSEGLPKAPDDWGPGSDYEIRTACPTCGPVKPSGVKCPTCGGSLDGPWFAYQSFKSHGKWGFVNRDGTDTLYEDRGETNRAIGKVLAEVDPRTYGQTAEEMKTAYDILDVISLGLGHGVRNLCSARQIFLYLDTTSDYALQWGDLFIRASLAAQDFASASNLMEELSSGEEARYSTQFARATSLHPTYYLGKATVALLASKDIPKAIEWADRAKSACVGVPGAVEKAIGIKRIATTAKRIAERRGCDEEDALDQVVKALQGGMTDLWGQKLPQVDVKRLTG